MIMSDKTRAATVFHERKVGTPTRGARRSQGKPGQDTSYAQKDKGRIGGRRKAMCVWEMMSTFVGLEGRTCGGTVRPERKAGPALKQAL